MSNTRTFALGAALSKCHANGKAQNLMIGYRRCSNEDEARGSFTRAIEKDKPGYSIDQLICLEIPEQEPQ